MNISRSASFVRFTALMLLFIGLIILLATLPPETAAAPEDEVISILPIGDSITAGYNENAANVNREQATYRLPLYWLLFKYSSKCCSFIGENSKNYNHDLYPKTFGDEQRKYNEVQFSLIPYTGKSGQTSEAIRNDVVSYATKSILRGNVVALIQAGTNDVKEGISTDKWLENLGVIIKHLKDNKNPGMTIFLANIIPVNNKTNDTGRADETRTCKVGVSFAVAKEGHCTTLTNTNIDMFNARLKEWCKPEPPNEFASKCTGSYFTNLGVDVYLVDQNAINLYYDEPLSAVLTGEKDNIHPNVKGEAYMAAIWYWALSEFSIADVGIEDKFCTDWGLKEEACQTKPTPYEGPCEDAPGNLLAINCGFSEGKKPWRFWSSEQGSFVITTANAYTGSTAAKVTAKKPGSNIQLYQSGFALWPNTSYELSFAAYSSDGRDMKVAVHKHDPRYGNYGLPPTQVDLGTEWQEYVINFTTPDRPYMFDGRLRFWFAPFAAAGTVYYIDEVELVPVIE